jgi:hypothetical protein
MLISDKQHEANRANAQKSTGPRTEEGRKRASLNALKHGCTAQTLILPGEDANHFAKFHHNLQTSLSPANALEESLVETLAQNQWATNRIRAHETNLFALGHEQHADSIDTDDLARLSHLEGIFDYVRPGRVVKPNDCNKGMPKPVAVKTYSL